MNISKPNMYIGVSQLMALASCLRHEEIREEVERSLDVEMREPLLIRLERLSPHVLISNHALLTEDPQGEALYKKR